MRIRRKYAAAALAALACAAAATVWFAIGWSPSVADSYPRGTVLRDSDGRVMRISLGPDDIDCRPSYVADFDDWIVKAVIAAEDANFLKHRGVNPPSVARAFCQNVFYGKRVSGASTISMQAIRLIKPHRKTYWNKLVEAIQAVKMERVRDKRWIMTQYLNRAPFGSNFVGIEAAASGWFGKSARELTIDEAALLAGMLQAPSRFRPDRRLERSLKRRGYVLGRMRECGFITDGQLERSSKVVPEIVMSPRPFRHPFFCDWAASVVADGAGGATGDYVTTLDERVQETLDRIVGASANGYSVAAVVMDVESASIVAMSCSGDYFDTDSGQVNTAVAHRPAGSTLKPFIVAKALDRGIVAPDEKLLDIPMTFGGYTPANFDSKYRGEVPLHDALVQSLNIPFIAMLNGLVVGNFSDCLSALGVEEARNHGKYGLGLAVGNIDVSLLELVGAYGAVARGGVALPPMCVKGQGGSGTRVFSPEACYIVSEILSGDERSQVSLGHVADVAMPRFAWKTGTSSAFRDAWTVLWNPKWVVGVWCGHKIGGFNDPRIVGAKAAAPIAWSIARVLYPQGDGPWFEKPDGVKACQVCSASGRRAGPDCPSTVDGTCIAGVYSALCGVHVRDMDGNVVERIPAALAAFSGKAERTEKLAILKPKDGASFKFIGGMANQNVVFEVGGNVADGVLWWYVDGVPSGTTRGGEKFVWPMEKGSHAISCSTRECVSATVRVQVE